MEWRNACCRQHTRGTLATSSQRYASWRGLRLYRELIFGTILAIRFVFAVFGIAIANNNRPAIPKPNVEKTPAAPKASPLCCGSREPTNKID